MSNVNKLDFKCTIGVKLKEECHKLTYSRHVEEIILSELAEEDRVLLVTRSGISNDDGNVICLHHKNMFLSRFKSREKYCCDPCQRHSKKITKSLLLYMIYI